MSPSSELPGALRKILETKAAVVQARRSARDDTRERVAVVEACDEAMDEIAPVTLEGMLPRGGGLLRAPVEPVDPEAAVQWVKDNLEAGAEIILEWMYTFGCTHR